jgi:phosphoglycerol transferase MdoB-like AlkP superfamily enzyme
MGAFGFKRFADERSFANAKRAGPYICDEAVGEFLVAELTGAGRERPLFVYAVTMEAHDPYRPDRLPDLNDPIQQYIHHVENADRMLARIVKAVDCGHRRVMLVFFGDHVPFLPSFADPFPDHRTDYFIAELGQNADHSKVMQTVSRPEHLHQLICARLSEPARALVAADC